MCRMFLFSSKHASTSSKILNQVNPIINSWIKSTELDPLFIEPGETQQHDHGYGSYQCFSSEPKKENILLSKSWKPAFEDRPYIKLNGESVSQYFLLNHARKASKSMPISINQNHPFVNESGTLILAHNGTLSKKILISLLKHEDIFPENLSDTQILFTILKDRFEDKNSDNIEELYNNWKELITVIKQIHENQKKDYSMNLLFLVKNIENNSFTLFFTSSYSELDKEKYFKLYLFENSNFEVFSSSTIKDYLEKEFSDDYKTWNIKTIDNNSIGFFNLVSNNYFVEQL